MFQKGANLTSNFTYIDNEIIEESGDDIFLLYTLNTILYSEFTLIEEEPEEIDIQGIEEKEWYGSQEKDEILLKLVKAVKQLDRKINNKE